MSLKNLAFITFCALSIMTTLSCGEDGELINEIDTYEEQVEEYGFGVKIVDSYYLSESAVGTRLVVTIDITNESEPTTLTFQGNGNRNRPTPYVVTEGAGNLSSAQFGPGDNFADEFEADHSWCILPVMVSKGGSSQCSIFFYQNGQTFSDVDQMVIKVMLEGTFTDIVLTNKFESKPRKSS